MPDCLPSDSLPSVSIIVLNYNSLEHLDDNLGSLLRLEYPRVRLELLLVDNASTDGSTEWVAEHYPSVRIVQNGANLGFAAGNTSGVKAARGEWVAILNPDMRVSSDWLLELIRRALDDPEIVCVASRVLSWDGLTIDFADAAINFMGWGCQPGFGNRRLNDFNQDRQLLFANGGSMLIKKQVFLDAGGFDPEYFAFFEDVDLGWRLWLMGYKVVLAPKAIVYHRHHGSWEHVNDAKRWLLAERNALFTLIKNYDDDSLARVLPPALLLLLQRAYLDIRPDPGAFADIPPMAAGSSAAFGCRYYFMQTWNLMQRRDLGQLLRRASAELRRRWNAFNSGALKSASMPAQEALQGQFQVPAIALSRLLAGSQVRQAFPKLMQARTQVQAKRKLPDSAIFPLFKWSLISNFDDERFIQAMSLVVGKFDLARLFGGKATPSPLAASTRGLSGEVSQMLFELVDQSVALSEVQSVRFGVGEPDPESTIGVPVASVALLAKANHLLWSLPSAPLPELLSWLKIRLEELT